jgi:tryptophan 2-C-methyltransferase
MKSVFVNTNRIKPPIGPVGLEYVAESVSRGGHDIEILDLAWSAEPLSSIETFFSKQECELVAVTLRNSDDCAFTTRESFLEPFERIVKQIRRCTDAVVAIGGVGFSVMPEKVLELTGADVGVWGEGEFTLREMADRIARGETFDDLPNLVMRRGERWVRTPIRFGDLTELPHMVRGWFDNKRYFVEGGQAGVETKRGCPLTCTYCADPVAKGGISRLRPPASVVDEIESLLAMGIDHFHTCDAEFNIPEAHARAVCEEIVRRNLGTRLCWYAYCTPRPFGPETARLMRRAGCVGINFGVDHGDDAMLKRLKRFHTAEDIQNAAHRCRDAGIAVMCDLLLGSPGETLGSIRTTIELMKRCPTDLVGVALGLRVWPGTALAQTLLNPTPHPGLVGGSDPTNPLFYLEPDIAENGADFIETLVKGDKRFLFFNPERASQNYNYNDNQILVDAISIGHRGAYWDILRKYDPFEC